MEYETIDVLDLGWSVVEMYCLPDWATLLAYFVESIQVHKE